MRALELAQLDDNTTSLPQVRRIKEEKDGIALAKDSTNKAKVEAKAKVETS